MPSPEDLRALLRKAKDGDVEALKDLVAELEIRLLLFVRKGLLTRHVKDHATAEEIVQEAIIRFHRVLNEWDPAQDHSGLALASTIAHNLVISHLRKAKHEVQSESLGQRPDGSDTPADEVIRAAELAALHEALASLPDDMRAILTARFFEGQPLSGLLRERGRADYQWFYHHEYMPALKLLRERLGPWFPEFADAWRQAHE
jgi:RNA polymerase sigma factor (sigma-70 family)